MFEKSKFMELKPQRRAEMILKTIESVESTWEQQRQKNQSLQLLKQYLDWFCDSRPHHETLSHLDNVSGVVDESISLRALLNLAVPFERYINRSLKDHQFIKVIENDRLQKASQRIPLVFVLDHLRSAFNVGGIFRLAEGLGVSHIHLIGYTPTPNEDSVCKTAMGAEKMVPWSQWNHRTELYSLLREQQIPLIGLETVDHGVSLFDFKAPESLAVFVGNERFGLESTTLMEVNQCVYIPMRGRKNSLNVSQSLGMFSAEVCRQWQI